MFDGYGVVEARCVVIDGDVITTIGEAVPLGAEIVEVTGTLLPGLIDAHVHTNRARQALALRFGVTTTLEMQGGQ